MQSLSNLLNAVGRVFKQQLYLQRHIIVDPVGRCAVAHLLHHAVEILGRDVELLAIPRHLALLAEVVLYQLHKLGEDALRTCGGALARFLASVESVAEVIDHRRDERLHRLPSEVVLRVLNLAFDHRHISFYALRLLRQQGVDRVETRKDEERRHLVDVFDDLVKEIVLEHQTQSAAISTEPCLSRFLVVRYDNDVVRMNHMLHRINGVAGLALQAHTKEQTLHAGCLL